MGCFESRVTVKPGFVRFISQADFDLQKEENKYVLLDCTIDSFDGKHIASDFYKFRSIDTAYYLDQNKWIDRVQKKPIARKLTAEEVKIDL